MGAAGGVGATGAAGLAGDGAGFIGDGTIGVCVFDGGTGVVMGLGAGGATGFAAGTGAEI